MGRGKSKTERKKPALSITFFLTGILVVSLSLVLLNCGKSKQKSIMDGGDFALDFSLATADKSILVFISNPNRGALSLEGTEFTVEAWVKSKTANLNGGVFSRYDQGGIALYVKDNVPKFSLRLPSGITSTDYIVESNVSIAQDEWQHIAAVLVDEDHSSVHQDCTDKCSTTTSTTCTVDADCTIKECSVTTSTTCTVDADCPTGETCISVPETCVTDAESQTPHLDIYVDGVFSNCASTGSSFISLVCELTTSTTCTVDADCPTGETCITLIGDQNLGNLKFPLDGLTDPRFDGIIDEVRLYGIAKTAAEINETKDRKLNESEMVSDDLMNYWKNDVGKGFTVIDSSGGADNGTIFECNPGVPVDNSSCILWDRSWTAGDWP